MPSVGPHISPPPRPYVLRNTPLRFLSPIRTFFHANRHGSDNLPGPKPEFFFAPAYAEQRIADWGNTGFFARLAEAWGAFITTTGWLRIVEQNGPDAVRLRYLAALQGQINPAEGEMLSMWAG